MTIIGIILSILSIIGILYLYCIDLPNYLDQRAYMDREVERLDKKLKAQLYTSKEKR